MNRPYVKITFQQGERKVHGKNGCTLEDVVDVLIDRLKYSLRGAYKNQDTETALLYLEQAKESLQSRGRVYND